MSFKKLIAGLILAYPGIATPIPETLQSMLTLSDNFSGICPLQKLKSPILSEVEQQLLANNFILMHEVVENGQTSYVFRHFLHLVKKNREQLTADTVDGELAKTLTDQVTKIIEAYAEITCQPLLFNKSKLNPDMCIRFLKSLSNVGVLAHLHYMYVLNYELVNMEDFLHSVGLFAPREFYDNCIDYSKLEFFCKKNFSLLDGMRALKLPTENLFPGGNPRWQAE
ncbi:MAG: hypothetical protein LBJ89_04610 [Holosporales bacterium]|jgi:hypothetical protein|nr:hypothetical protein [Holosporales bacterium]